MGAIVDQATKDHEDAKEQAERLRASVIAGADVSGAELAEAEGAVEIAALRIESAKRIEAENREASRERTVASLALSIDNAIADDGGVHATIAGLRDDAERALVALARAVAAHSGQVETWAGMGASMGEAAAVAGVEALPAGSSSYAPGASIATRQGRLVAMTVDAAVAAAVAPVLQSWAPRSPLLIEDDHMRGLVDVYAKSQKYATGVAKLLAAPPSAAAAQEQRVKRRQAEKAAEQVEQDKRDLVLVIDGTWDTRIAALVAAESADSAIQKLRDRKAELLVRRESGEL